jgi:hypothetical protein
MAFSAQSVPKVALPTIENVMPNLSKSRTETDERCFLCGPSNYVISRTSCEWVRRLLSSVAVSPLLPSKRIVKTVTYREDLVCLVVVYEVSKSKLCLDWWSVGQFFLVSGTHLGSMSILLLLSDICLFVDVERPLWEEGGSVVCSSCWAFPGPESRGTHGHVLVSQIWDSFNLEGQAPVFISPGTRWSSYTPRHWILFSSPLRTRRARVEVFDPPPNGVHDVCRAVKA